MNSSFHPARVVQDAPSFLSKKQMAGLLDAASVKAKLKHGIWAYFLLLIFEGALRKWVLPGLATPLLIVRDPLALWLVLTAWRRGFLPANPYMFLMVLIGVIGVYTAVFWGHGNLVVAVYGARIMLIHFPLIFVISCVFDREDVIKIGKVVLWMAVPMTVLIALQFYSPQSAWVNRGVGGDLRGAGFGGALDYFRPPGTFSFTNGTTLFYSLVTCFVFYFWTDVKSVNRILLVCATGSLLVAIPLSISRAVLFQFIISLIFTLCAVSKKPKYLGSLLLAVFVGVLAFFAFKGTSFFQTAGEAFSVRLADANQQEGGLKGVLLDRYLGGLIGALGRSTEQTFFGYGLGKGTNVGSMLLEGGRFFLIAEDEWARIIGELGPIMGMGVIFIRLGISIKMTAGSYRRLAAGDLLPWMLLSFCLLVVPQAPWAQPTSLGFSILIGGMVLAVLDVSD